MHNMINHFIDIEKAGKFNLVPKQVMVTRQGRTFKQTVYVNLNQPVGIKKWKDQTNYLGLKYNMKGLCNNFSTANLSEVVVKGMGNAIGKSMVSVINKCPKLKAHTNLINFDLVVKDVILAGNGRKQLGNAGLCEVGKKVTITVVKHKNHNDVLPPAIGKWRTGQNTSSTFRHELGHHIWYKVVSLKDRNYWKDLFKVNGKPYWEKAVSGYGSTDHEECFAEAFAAYTSSKYKKGLLPVEVEDYMDSITKGDN